MSPCFKQQGQAFIPSSITSIFRAKLHNFDKLQSITSTRKSEIKTKTCTYIYLKKKKKERVLNAYESRNEPASALVKQRGGVILNTLPKKPPFPISTPISTNKRKDSIVSKNLWWGVNCQNPYRTQPERSIHRVGGGAYQALTRLIRPFSSFL